MCDNKRAFVNRGRGRGRGRGFSGKQNSAKIVEPSEMEHSHEAMPSPSKPAQNLYYPTILIELDLDEPTKAWFAQLKSSWSYLKKSPSVVNMIIQRYEMSANPYEEALKLMYNCVDFKYAKPKSLAHLIMEEFKTWSSSVRNKIIHLLTTDIKISAFNVVRKQSIFSFMKLVAEIYEMSLDCDIFLDIIHHMIQQKQYKEACQSAALLGLHKKFGINEFLMPLILQDKNVVAEEFLAESPAHQEQLVSFLDSVLGRSSSIKTTLEEFALQYEIPDIKWHKVHYKSFRKLITRLKKIYNLPDEVTPSLIKKQNEGALQFLVHRRYVENAIGDESFKEMVHEAVQGDPKLQQDLVHAVAHHFDLETALYLAYFYKVPQKNWPNNVRMYQENPDLDRPQQQNHSTIEELWDVEPSKEYHKLNVPLHNVYVIDCESSFENFLDVKLQDVSIVGIDCEWKPSFGSQMNELALIQIATHKEVYILDVIRIGQNAVNLWQKFGKCCFNNCDILKLGFGLISDMSMIRQSLPHININQRVGFLDLLNLWRQLEKHSKFKFPYEVQSGGPSLSTLVHQCLGLPLNKADQFSNWEKRPLRETQIVYAALDAYCLIEVYDVLRNCCEKINLPFDDVCYHQMNSTKTPQKKPKKSFSKRRSTEEVPQPPSPSTKPITADQIKFVCDTMLQGLAKHLRKCGLDTVMLDNFEDHMTCVKLYQDENRFILTKGQIFNKLNGYVVPGHCLKLLGADCNDQLKEILDYYKIVLTKENVFSRCQLCNAKSFVQISKSTMCALIKSSQSIAATIASRSYVVEDDDLADEATGFSSEDDFDDEPVYRKPPPNRKWDLCADEKLDVGLCQTRLGAKIQVEAIPTMLLPKLDFYYVCEECGKVYWDGSHFDRILAGTLQGIVI